MILINIPSVAKCPATDCKREQPVELCLLAGGTLGFRPTEKGWQILLTAPGAPIIAKCPDHHEKLNVVEKPSMLHRIGG